MTIQDTRGRAPRIQAIGNSSLQGPTFESDISKQQGRALLWIETMLGAGDAGAKPSDSDLPKLGRGRLDGRWGPSKQTVARTALKNLLSANPQAMKVSVDQSYSETDAVARAYFQVSSDFSTLASLYVVQQPAAATSSGQIDTAAKILCLLNCSLQPKQCAFCD